ncbi:MAG: tetratricopeptide repeat protein [Pseudomonadota bacterium]
MQPSQSEKAALIGLFRAKRFAEACTAARAFTRRYPKALDGWNIRGAAARELGQLHEAQKAFCELERLAPTFAGAPYNLGLVMESKGADQDAIAAYSRALKLDPNLAQAQNNLGGVCLRLGDLDRAYTHLKRATELQPGWPEVHNTFGNTLKRLARFDEAREAYRKAITAGTRFAKAHYNLGVLESEVGNRGAAIEAFKAALAAQPDYAIARASLLNEYAHRCDWDALSEHAHHIARLGVETGAVPPFPMLALEDNPARQLTRARQWAKTRFGHIQPRHPLPARPTARPRRLRVGYLGADFHDHPGMRLMAGMLREHDRSRFEVHAISYGRLRDDKWRAISESVADVFHDIHGLRDAPSLELVRSLNLDIAIDRKGYTTDTRSDWFGHRLAPVQINYLGYPSTMAAPFMDYMVADRTIIPERHRAHYAEKIIWLPDTYMPADNALEIAPERGSRADHGLPEGALVLCCFNNLYKITVDVFAIWMRVMRAVDRSVLWLFASNEEAQTNLHAAAKAAGVDPERLIFAPRLPNDEHLERHRHADLFIDTFPCNAHTTCNDALWAGLPVVTRTGDQMASRVAASLLKAVGLPELITSRVDEYEALILDLATDDAKRNAIRTNLAALRPNAALFDTVRYIRHLEAGYDAAFDRAVKGLPPGDITVAAQTGQKG